MTAPRKDSGILAFDFSPTIGILARDMDRMGVDIRSWRVPLTNAVRNVMIPSFQQNFEAGGRPDHWEPLSEATIEIRSRQGSGSTTLVRSGALKRNMGFLSMWDITQDYAILKQLPNRIWYGALHQSGYGTTGAQIQTKIKQAAKSGRKLSTGAAAKMVMSDIDAKLKKALTTGASIGSSADRAHPIPARPFVMFQDEDLPKIDDEFRKWIDMRVEAAGFKG